LTKLSDFYNEIDGTTGPEFSFRMAKTIKVASRFKINQILDIGCGDGRFSVAFANACHCDGVIGIDISRKLVKDANSRFPAAIATFDPRLPFRDEQFGAVLCSELIEHLVDPDSLLTEIFRVLVPGGKLFLTTPNLASWINRISLLLGFQPHFSEVSLRHNVGKLYGGIAAKDSETAIAGHLRLFVPRSLEAILKINGFDVIAREGAGIGYGGKSILPFPISLVDRLFLSRYSTSAFLIYVGSKNC
jgi:ubiquinone/menaquinone biosynthesis C-methylase UbiE